MRLAAPTCLAIAILAANPGISRAEFRHLSSRLIGGPSNERISSGSIVATAVKPRLFAVGDSGDFFLIVETDEAVSFGGAPVGPGIVAARIRSDGTLVWSRVLVISGGPIIAGIAAAANGAAVLAGQFFGTVDFGGGVLTATPPNDDVFVVKLDEGGAVAWQRRFGDKLDQMTNDVRVAPNGDVFIIGSNFGTIDFGGGGIRSNGGGDVFLARLDVDGGHIWSRGYGQVGTQNGLRLAMGHGGRIAIACQLVSGGIDFGGGPLNPYVGGNIATAVLDANAGHIWSRIIGSTSSVATSDIAVDDFNDLFVSGSFGRSLDAGGGFMVAAPNASGTGFVASYGPGGAYRWSYMVADSLRSNAQWLGTDHSGNCFLVATKSGALEVPGLTLTASGFFLLAFDSLGSVTGASGFGKASASVFQGFVTTQMVVTSDQISLAGSTGDKIDFGGGMLYPDSFDVFLAKLEVRRPARVVIGGFTARYNEGRVELRWDLTSGEPLQNQFLTRTDAKGSGAQVIYSGAATDGETTVIDGHAQPGHLYTYEITVETALGDAVSNVTSVSIPVFQTNLAQNAPNPFNPVTTFSYSLATPASVSIAIYDLSGALVARLDQGMQPAGTHQAKWGGHNWEGSVVASGVYFYRLEGAGDVGARKMVLLK